VSCAHFHVLRWLTLPSLHQWRVAAWQRTGYLIGSGFKPYTFRSGNIHARASAEKFQGRPTKKKKSKNSKKYRKVALLILYLLSVPCMKIQGVSHDLPPDPHCRRPYHCIHVRLIRIPFNPQN